MALSGWFFLYFCPVKTQIEAAAKVIQDGGIILYPTDTVWGLGCDPKNEIALQKINTIKQRHQDKSFILLVNSENLLSRYAKIIPDVCFDLIDFANQPLTIIYPQGQYVSNQVLGSDDSIAIRFIKHEFCSGLITKLRHGLVSTSANISGQPFPKNFDDINEDIKSAVDLIIDRKFEVTKYAPSQIIKIGEDGEVKIIRK